MIQTTYEPQMSLERRMRVRELLMNTGLDDGEFSHPVPQAEEPVTKTQLLEQMRRLYRYSSNGASYQK